MNILVPLIIIAAIVIFIGFKWNNLRTKLAFVFIMVGVLVLIFFAFMVITGSTFDFSSVGNVLSSLRLYLVWAKEAAVSVFEITGRAIGVVKNTFTG